MGHPVDGVTNPIIQHIFVKGQDLKENKNILNNWVGGNTIPHSGNG